MPAITDSVQFVKGIGPKKVKLFEKLHISTLQDALETYPRDYEDRTHITRIADIADEDRYAVRAILGTEPKVSRIRKGMTLVKCTIFDESGSLGVTWFNQPYITAQLRVGQEYLFYGRVQGFGRARQMISPQAEKVAENDQNPGRIVPVYPLTAGLTQRDMARVTEAALDAVPGDWPDPLPEVLRVKYRLPDAADALAAIHRPKNREDVNEARRRMVFEELFLLCCGLQQLRERRRADSGILFRGDRLEEFFAALPFAPTGAQRRAIMEIAADCASGHPMNRLVQGDVGCGKTALAFGAIAMTCACGYQAAMMAPTEILARQHYESAKAMLEPLGIHCGLLIGSMRPKAKREAQEACANGEYQAVFGTHALISEKVAYQRLGLVVTDEQHRFGVMQRSTLQQKGADGTKAPHVLVMSATPIPRTLALILYGDLDVSIVDELPPGRTPVKTRVVPEEKRAGMYGFLRQEVLKGHQAYVVCPLVEDSEMMEDVRSAQATFDALKNGELSGLRVGLTWGAQPADEKAQVLSEFSAGNLDVLVSTTVIEVGVNVPNASVMVIENAERFGLSQLHQLRGRVGRGSAESWCFLLAAENERLRILTQTNDGFIVAQKDLELRGPGDLMGTRQSGEMMADFLLDGDVRLLDEAAKCMKRLRENPKLTAERQQVEAEALRNYRDKLADIAMN